jgi:hypothetical protein
VPDRLKELQQQRALVQEQLAWLDREIAAIRGKAETGSSPTPGPIKPASTPRAALPTRAPDQTAETFSAEEIIAQYQNEAQSLHGNVKRGCFLYFFLALGLLGLGVLALYLFRTKA